MNTHYYYKTPEQVLFYNPWDRLIAKLFGHNTVVRRCTTCNKIPSDMYGDKCFDHRTK